MAQRKLKIQVSTISPLGRFVRFAATSVVSGVIVDKGVAWLLFNLLRNVMGARDFSRILISNIVARALSLTLNYSLNRRFVFTTGENGAGHADIPNSETLPRYVVLAAGILVLSTTGVWWASKTFGVSEVLAKMGVDFLLFFVNYVVQTTWVFRSATQKAKKMRASLRM